VKLRGITPISAWQTYEGGRPLFAIDEKHLELVGKPKKPPSLQGIDLPLKPNGESLLRSTKPCAGDALLACNILVVSINQLSKLDLSVPLLHVSEAQWAQQKIFLVSLRHEVSGIRNASS